MTALEKLQKIEEAWKRYNDSVELIMFDGGTKEEAIDLLLKFKDEVGELIDE